MSTRACVACVTLVLLWASMGLAWNMLSGYSGLISFGLIGIFIGPLVLAVAHTLLNAWVRGDAVQKTPAV